MISEFQAYTHKPRKGFEPMNIGFAIQCNLPDSAIGAYGDSRNWTDTKPVLQTGALPLNYISKWEREESNIFIRLVKAESVPHGIPYGVCENWTRLTDFGDLFLSKSHPEHLWSDLNRYYRGSLLIMLFPVTIGTQDNTFLYFFLYPRYRHTTSNHIWYRMRLFIFFINVMKIQTWWMILVTYRTRQGRFVFLEPLFDAPFSFWDTSSYFLPIFWTWMIPFIPFLFCYCLIFIWHGIPWYSMPNKGFETTLYFKALRPCHLNDRDNFRFFIYVDWCGKCIYSKTMSACRLLISCFVFRCIHLYKTVDYVFGMLIVYSFIMPSHMFVSLFHWASEAQFLVFEVLFFLSLFL